MGRGLTRTARIAWIAGWAVVVFAVWLAAASHSVGIAFFYSVPVGFAAWWFGPRAGLVVALLCACLYAIGNAIHPTSEFALALVIRAAFLLLVVAAVSWVATRLRLLEHSAEELEAIRAALTPADLPDLPDVDAAAAFVPSELGVSGDFYLLTNGPDGRELVSAVCVRLRPGEGSISWARAGHPPPLRLPELDELPLNGSTFLLGAEEQLELENREDALTGSDGLVVYTDGATDVRRGRQMLGLEGLRGMLAPLSGLAARAMVDELERAILVWADRPIKDDICLVMLKPKLA